jgi:hypothetical protein
MKPSKKLKRCDRGIILCEVNFFNSGWNSSQTSRISSREEDIERGISTVTEDSCFATIFISAAQYDMKTVTKNDGILLVSEEFHPM